LQSRLTAIRGAKRSKNAESSIRTYLGRVIRDTVRKIKGEAEPESAFAPSLMLARRVREQRQHQRGPKVYSLHAPGVECIGKSLPSLTRGTTTRSPPLFEWPALLLSIILAALAAIRLDHPLKPA
jgi:hypothetical protein